jgi:AcrR family transcriptional regulator
MKNEKKKNTQEKINKAAQTLVFLYGIKGWNMDQCAKEAGVTKRTLYKYIDSKEKLVEKVLFDYIQNTQAALVQQLNNIPDFLTGLETILDIYPALIMKMNSRVIQDIFKQFPTIEEHLINKRLSFTADIKNYIQQGQRQGVVNSDVDADTIIEIMQSLIIYYSKSNPEHFGEKIRESFRTVIYGIIPKGTQ